MRALSLLATLTMLSSLPAVAHAELLKFSGTLSPQAEVPPHPDLKGSGTVDATYDTASKTLTYTATFQGLTGKAVMAHFHAPAPTGKNAGVEVPVQGALTSPIEGSATLTEAQAKALEDGDTCFNIHTEANKAGELRAQMAKRM